MARTITEIYDEIIAEKESNTSLAGLTPDPETSAQLLSELTSASKVAVWRLWAYIIAVAIHVHELLFDLFIQEIDAIAAAAPAGTPRWYKKKIEEFQFGDNLQLINNQYVYDPIDVSNQIIKRSAIEERADGVVIIKVVKDDGNDGLEELNATELAALTSYAQKIKFAGARLAIVSIPADTVNVSYDIYYDPIIPLVDLQSEMQIVVDAFLNNLDFNAAFNITRFTDILQPVNGVIDPVFQTANNTPSGGSLVSFDIEVIPAAGWFVYSDTIENMFNFIPTV